MKLFTKSDLERAARLAATAAYLRGGDPETHLAAAVATVAQESPRYYDEHQIRDALGPDALRTLLDRVEHREARD